MKRECEFCDNCGNQIITNTNIHDGDKDFCSQKCAIEFYKRQYERKINWLNEKEEQRILDEKYRKISNQ